MFRLSSLFQSRCYVDDEFVERVRAFLVRHASKLVSRDVEACSFEQGIATFKHRIVAAVNCCSRHATKRGNWAYNVVITILPFETRYSQSFERFLWEKTAANACLSILRSLRYQIGRKSVARIYRAIVNFLDMVKIVTIRTKSCRLHDPTNLRR